MTDCSFGNWFVSGDELRSLIVRASLTRDLLRRQIEEQITHLVFPVLKPTTDQWDQFLQSSGLTGLDIDFDERSSSTQLQDWLTSRDWTLDDLDMHILRPHALTRFKNQRYGPGVEELFLARKNDLDSVIYSLLRVKDPGLARELWISLSEGEVAFAELAERFSDGPESSTKGVIGPLPMGSIENIVADRLRGLRKGQLRPPEALGGWHVLLRLESLNPARLDQATRNKLLDEQFESWIKSRVDAILSGDTPDPLHIDTDA